MYIEKINCIASDIEQIKRLIKTHKKEIKKRENILALQVDEVLETEILQYKEEIENLREQLKIKKQLLKNYKKL